VTLPSRPEVTPHGLGCHTPFLLLSDHFCYYLLMSQAQVEVEAPNGLSLSSRFSPSGATGTRWLQVKEVARLLDVHPITVRRMIRQGRLPAVQLGGRGAPLRVDRAELEAWLYGEPEEK
jgi:excisionase family DNA binding protein